jgi:two-component system, NarL family, nitrate/nitrite response regulator NarL
LNYQNNICKIVVADDHHVLRMGLNALFSNVEKFQVVGEAKDGHSALEVIRSTRPDLVLMDMNLPGMSGLEASKKIRKEFPNIRILAISATMEGDTILSLVQMGASGFILKETPAPDLIDAIKAVAAGHTVFPDAALMLMNEHQKSETEEQKLTERESEILNLVSQGLTSQEIGASLFISARTVETHKRNLMQKLKVKNALGLSKYFHAKKTK